MPLKIQESGETYLETILLLERKNGNVRSIDIATELGYSKPSVSRAVGILKNEAYLVVEGNGNIILTEKGRARAEAIYERHCTIAAFLNITLDIPMEQAEEDSCRMEHIISEETFRKVKEYVKKHQ